MTTVLAKDHLDPQGVIVRSADLVANAIISKLKGDDLVELELNGLPGVSSSYYNLALRRIVAEVGVEGLDRIRVRFASKLQQTIFERSMIAIRAETEGPT